MRDSLGEDRDYLYERRLVENEPQQQIWHGDQAVKQIQAAIKKSKNGPGDPKTYCVDFDSVLAHHETGDPLDKIGEPLTPGIQMAKRIKAAGHKLVILTARPQPMHETINGWLKGQGVRADEVTNVKPPAEMYIDDRAVAWPKNYGGQAHVFTSKRNVHGHGRTKR